MSHTATPFVRADKDGGITVRGAHDLPVAEIWFNGAQEANADFIVRACNSHDALVDALSTAYLRLLLIGDYRDRHTSDGQSELCLIVDALSEATGRDAENVQAEFESVAASAA